MRIDTRLLLNGRGETIGSFGNTPTSGQRWNRGHEGGEASTLSAKRLAGYVGSIRHIEGPSLKARTVSPNHHMPSKRIQALTGVQAYRLIARRGDILRTDIKRQDLGPRQPADSGKVVAANAGCGWLKQRNEFDTATT